MALAGVASMPSQGAAYDLSIWTKRDGEWVCVIHSESPAGDPFGRH